MIVAGAVIVSFARLAVAQPPPRDPHTLRVEAAASRWEELVLTGLRPYVGLTMVAGPSMGGALSFGSLEFDPHVYASLLFGLRAGLQIDAHQLEIEVSPMTFVWNDAAPGPAFEVGVGYAYLLELHAERDWAVYWPLRFGAGFFVYDTSGAFFVSARVDLLGVLFRYGHVLIDVHLPSIRYAMTPGSLGFGDSGHVFWANFGVSVAYVF